MIKTKIIVKPKDGSSSSGSVTEGSYGSGYADYAASAGRSKQSDRSALATLAETAISAYRAKRADMASELDPDSETLQGYVLKEWLGKLLTVVDGDGTEQDINGTVGDGMKIMPHLALTSIDVAGDGHISLGGMQMVYDAEHGAWRLDGSLYVTGGLSALGNSDVAGGGGGGLDAELLWSMLGKNGTEQINKSHITEALAGYATEDWVEGKGYLTEASLDGLKDNLKYVSNIVAGESVSAKDLLGADAVTVDYKEFYRETAIDFNRQRIEIVMDLSAVQRTGKETFVRLGKDIKNDHTILMELLHNDPTGRPKELWFSFIGFGISKRYVYNKLDYQDLLYFTIERGKITLNGTVIPSEYYSDDFFDLTSLQIGSRVVGCLTGVIYRKMDVVDKQHPEGLQLDYSYSDGEQKSVTLPVATNLSNGLLTSKEKRLLDIIPLQYATKKDLEKNEKFIANFSTVQIKDTMPILDRECPFNPNNGIWQYQLHINYDYYKVEITFDISTCKNNEEEIFSFGESIASWNTGKPVMHLYYTKGNKTLKIDYLFGGTFSGESSLARGTFTSESGVFAVVISKNKITVNGSELDLKNHYELFNIRDVYVGQVIKENKFCNATFSKVCMTKVDGASGVLVEYDYNHSDETSGNYLLTDATEEMSGLMSSADKKLLNHISHGTITNWNSVYNWYSEVTSGDTDKVINKWGEIIDFLSGIEDTASLSGIVDGINGAISNEVSRATKAENDISSRLIAEVERSVKKDDALTNSIAEEISRAKGAEQTLTNNVSVNATAISDEVVRAKGAENTISSNLTAEIDRSTKKDNELSKSITDEVSRAKAAEQTLTKSITDEVSRAKAAEQTLTSNVSTNTSAINVLKGYFTNGVAKSAVKLQTAHKIWGNTFDGTQDVAGDIILPNGKQIKIGTASLSWDADNNAVKIDGSVYATGGVSALGNSDVAGGGGGGLMGSIVPYDKAIALTTQNEGEEIASAWSVKMLYDKIETIDVSGQLTSYLTKSEAQTLYQPVGNYLTSHQDISGKADRSELSGYLPLTGGVLTGNLNLGGNTLFAGDISVDTEEKNWNLPRKNSIKLLLCRDVPATGSPSSYMSGVSILTNYVGFQLVSYRGWKDELYFRKIEDNGVWHDWYRIYNEGFKPTKSDVGLGNVDNTADANKSVSYAVTSGVANSAKGISVGKLSNIADSTVKAHKDALVSYFNKNTGLGANVTIGTSIIENWNNDSATYFPTSTYSFIKISGSYSITTYAQYLLSSHGDLPLGVVGRSSSTWGKIHWIAYKEDIPTKVSQLGNDSGYITASASISGNAGSATKLQTARTIWGQRFDGTGDVSGTITGATNINASGRVTASEFNGNFVSDRTVFYFGNSANAIGSGTDAVLYAYGWNNLLFYTNGTNRMVIEGGGNIGIGTTTPTHKLHVNGDMATTGRAIVDSLQIGNITISYDAANKGLRIAGGGLYTDSYLSSLGVDASTALSVKKWADSINLTEESDAELATAYSIGNLYRLINSNQKSITQSLNQSVSALQGRCTSLEQRVSALEKKVN